MVLIDDLHPVLTAATPAQVTTEVHKIIVALGFDHFRFTRLYRNVPAPGQARVLTLSTYPKTWLEKYERENFMQVDPAARHCLHHWHPLPWTNSLFNTPNAAPLYEEACSFGIRAGGSLPVIAGVCGFGFARDQDADAALPDVLRALPGLNLLTGFMMEALNNAPPAHEPPAHQRLTQREIECVKLMAVGLQDDAIADRLHITPRTVRFHLGNARQKMGAVNRHQLIARAMAAAIL